MYVTIIAMRKKDKRGEWWKNIPPEERSMRGAYAVQKRWDRQTTKQKKAYGMMLVRSRNKKHGK